MSGFAGIVRSDGAPPDSNLLERMARHLAFRGPDCTDIWTHSEAAFCFSLLRTGPSPQAPTQPCSLDGRVWLVGDVRLDGREELIEQLVQAGQSLDANATNEELVLRAWQKWGRDSFETLTGDYSLALWDDQAKTLWCFRDLLGARPFFYAHVSGQLLFSNTLDALRLSPDVPAKLDPHFIGDFLLQSWCSDPQRTAFLRVRRLPAGYALTYSQGEVQVRRFASLPIEEPLLLKKPEEYLEQFRAHLECSVRNRLPRGGAGIFMSGGLDSTSAAATAKKVQTERGVADSLRAYTVDYSPLLEDQEGHFASLAAAHIGIPISVMNGATCPPFARWEEMSLRTPEPCAEPFWALHVEHYRQLAAEARVVLTGDGGDDILTGRAWPHLLYLLRRGRIASIATIFGGYVRQHGTLPPLRAGIRSRVLRLFGQAQKELDYPTWLEPNFEREFHLRDRWRELQQPAKAKSEHPLHPAGYASLSTAFWPNVYETEDAGWTGVPVETRAPFFDLRLVRFLLRVPPVPWCMDKQLLRDAMKGLLPEEVRLRRKTPLRGDPLQQHEEKNGWKPVLHNGYCESLRIFVNCSMLTATSRPALGLSLWNEIRPIALNIWLKSVENSDGIQYSQTGETE